MVTVYMESKNHSEIVATFQSEELYLKCLNELEKQAKKAGMIITESINED
jgi:hypothetical protein